MESKWFFVKSKHAKCQKKLPLNQCKNYTNSTTPENWSKTGQITFDSLVFMKKYYCKHTLSLTVRLHNTKFLVGARGKK